MIFSKQLGSLGGRTAQDDIRYMANHIRRMQEELEYRLAHLDSQNITEIDMGQTKIYSGNVTLSQVIKRNEDRFTVFQQNYSTFYSAVYGEGGLSEIVQGENGIQATVADLKSGLASTVKLLDNGLWVENADGSKTQINGGHIKLSGSITWGDLTDDAFDELQEVAWNAADAISIAEGEYYGGTFIDGTSIYSPTIYTNEFNVYPEVDEDGDYVEDSGSFNLYGVYNKKARHFLQIQYYRGDAPWVYFSSPYGAQVTWDFGWTQFTGTLDFSDCEIIWPE